MIEEPIGILLSKRQWNAFKRDNEDVSAFIQYDIKAKELGRKAIFFTLDHISLKENEVTAFELSGENLKNFGIIKIPYLIYNPTKYNKKTNIKKLRELAHSKNIKLINEHHVIKQKHLSEIIQSNEMLKSLTSTKENSANPLFVITVISQKEHDGKWRFPFKYIKDIDGEKYVVEEFPSIETPLLTLQKLDEICRSLLEMIHYYFPGIFELGLQFSINNNGDYNFESTCTINEIIKDLQHWRPLERKEIVEYPIVLANSILMNHSKDLQNHLPQKVDKEHDIETEPKQQFWVRFIETNDSGTIEFPTIIDKSTIANLETLKFGVKKVTCRFVSSNNTISLRESSYQNPMEIFISSDLVKELHIALDMVFQLSLDNKNATIGPIIGFLLGEKNHTYNIRYMEKYKDRLKEYEKFGGLVIAFSPRSINWDEKVAYGLIYDHSQKIWRYDSAPIPSVIYRRNFHQDQELINELKVLTNNNLFNSHHFNKSDLLTMQEEDGIGKHLPLTFKLLDINNLIEFLKEKKKIILKPVSLSRGRGIFILELKEGDFEQYYFYEFSNNQKVCHLLNDTDSLVEKFIELNILNNQYLYQTYIPLLKINGNPFDVRVVMQKYNKQIWECSGIECRVAGDNEDLTNISRGGKAMFLDEALTKSKLSIPYTIVHKRVIELCRSFCERIDQTGEHYAEFGLDIAIDTEGYPWILEANIFPSFKGFKRLDYDTYLKIRHQPLYYAVDLQGFNVLDEEDMLLKVYNSLL